MNFNLTAPPFLFYIPILLFVKHINQIDKKVQEFLSDRRSSGLNNLMIGFTSLGSAPFTFSLAAYIYLLGPSLLFKTYISAVMTAFIIIQTIKHLSLRERPVNQVLTDTYSSSFPSGHSTAGFLTATVLSSFYPEIMFISFLLASAVAFSRVYLGEHFLSDALTGSIIGITVGLLIPVII